ncbi:MAG: cupin domain-containing protein [Novosphingobium sp.]
MASGTATDIVARLGLARHPEGGWFRETWRAAAAPGERAGATAIYFLLEAGDRSHWHRVDAAELWLWHAGAPLNISITADAQAPVRNITLGPDVLGGQQPQALVPTGEWQSAESTDGWVLVSCVVSPAFEFAGFELAPTGWAPAGATD